MRIEARFSVGRSDSHSKTHFKSAHLMVPKQMCDCVSLSVHVWWNRPFKKIPWTFCIQTNSIMRNDLLLVQTAFQFHSPQFSKFHQETFKLCFIVIIIFFSSTNGIRLTRLKMCCYWIYNLDGSSSFAFHRRRSVAWLVDGRWIFYETRKIAWHTPLILWRNTEIFMRVRELISRYQRFTHVSL